MIFLDVLSINKSLDSLERTVLCGFIYFITVAAESAFDWEITD